MTYESIPAAAMCGIDAAALAERYCTVRGLSEALVAPLSDADATAQSMPDASPAKWHLAHTTWFFETFLLRDHVPEYRLYDPRWPYLFNSYYEAEGGHIARECRGQLTRPTLGEIIDYRRHVDAAIRRAMHRLAELCPGLVELGLNHEQQHQELLLSDVKHLFFTNPLGPAYCADSATPELTAERAETLCWHAGPAGTFEAGHWGSSFAFDCEGPAHRQYLAPYALADRTICNAEWVDFIEDGGYETASLWLADGWDWRNRHAIQAPLYWRAEGGGLSQFTLEAWRPIDPAAPVCHISFFEAEAFARWAGARPPNEAEWEAIARAFDPRGGNQLDEVGPVQPVAEAGSGELQSLFGNVWEWTGSAFRPYRGYRPAGGAISEYNGKFMSGQFVLKGGSCATPRGHMRASYRNFFYPHQRWQFTGLRLAKDL